MAFSHPDISSKSLNFGALRTLICQAFFDAKNTAYSRSAVDIRHPFQSAPTKSQRRILGWRNVQKNRALLAKPLTGSVVTRENRMRSSHLFRGCCSRMLFCSAISLGAITSQAASVESTTLIPVGKGIQAATSYYNDVSLPLYYLPPSRNERGEDGREGPENPPIRHPHVDEADPVIQNQFGNGTFAPVPAMPAPIMNFNGINYAGGGSIGAPPDPNGEVGTTQYVQMVNEALQVFNKTTGASMLGPIAISSIWSGFGGACELGGAGDPVVLFDQLANRWLVSQFASASGGPPLTDECIAISTSSDATGTWARYGFHLGSNLFDYPHLGVWPDGYYMSMNIYNAAGTAFLGPQAFAFSRNAMLAGTIATVITPGITGGPGERPFLPADLDGSTPPPVGAPAPFIGYPGAGGYKTFRFHADFATPANSTFTLAGTPAAAGFTQLCPDTRYCVPQGGTTNTLDAVADRLMFRVAYRNFGDHEALIGNFSVKANDVAGIRWFEMRNATSGAPTIYQEGTYQPDTDWRWMGSAAMDFVGNIAIGYSVSSGTIKPQLRYTGRLAGDPLNLLPQGEEHLFDGAGAQTGTLNRWGDYSDLTIDPVDDCTFWYTNQYLPADGTFNWATRIGSFKFPNCLLAPGFSLAATPAVRSVCAGTVANYSVNVGSILGFTNPVALAATGNPSPATFSPNPVNPGNASGMQVGTVSVATGTYPIQINGTASSASNRNTSVGLNVFASFPSTAAPQTPANGAINQPLRPTFTWTATNAETYTIEIVTTFSQPVFSATVTGNSATPNIDLAPNTQYNWRVRALNPCGESFNTPTVFTFTTMPPPGICWVGTSPTNIFSYDFESGPNGWTSSGTGNTWALSAAQPHAGLQSFFAANPATVSDQRLVSPPIVLPNGQLPMTLQFWHRRFMEIDATAGCFDGGILEVSTDAGATFTQIPTTKLMTDPYTGAINTGFGNPLAGLQAWCSAAVVPYRNSVVDISAYQGQTARFRYRLGSDSSDGREGWYIDDVKVQSCISDLIFRNGFDSSP